MGRLDLSFFFLLVGCCGSRGQVLMLGGAISASGLGGVLVRKFGLRECGVVVGWLLVV